LVYVSFRLRLQDTDEGIYFDLVVCEKKKEALRALD
jgi:hypothetical protein